MPMKRLITSLLLLVQFLWLSASPVSINVAKIVATNFLCVQKGLPADTFQLKLAYTYQLEGRDAFYVFSHSKGGFVIVSADNEAKPIIGYSTTSPATEKIDNPVVASRFEWYAKQVEHAAKNRLGNKAIQNEWETILFGKTYKKASVGPLLTTTWNQMPYYNQLCPSNTPTGCVATAMSQIMKYHSWPETGNGWHKYTHTTYGVQYAHFEETTYDWAHMPDVLTGTSSSTSKIAVATLCYHAGVAVNMDYDPEGSGAISNDVMYALSSYFKYDPSTINAYSFDANQQTEWIAKVKTEIDANRPVYYSGSSDASGGHAWVCDGYNDENMLHINWGWGGSYNGYFSADAMNPGTYNFSEYNSIITGIKPGINNQPILWVKQASGFSAPSRGIQYISAVNNRIAWAVAYDGSGSSSNVKDFTLTIDGGSTWKAGTVNATGTTGMGAAMVCAISDKIAWIPLYGSSGGGKIVKTTDGGNTWEHQSTATFTAPNGFPNVVYFWDENNGFCMGDPNNGYFEIYTTINGGNQWTRVPSTSIPANTSEEYGTVGYFDVIGNTVWFSTTKGRIFKSDDKGLTWTAYQTPLSGSFKITFKNESNGIICGLNGEVYEFYKTIDGGETWQQVTPSGDAFTADILYMPGCDTLISAGVDYKNNLMGISYSVDEGTTFTCYANFYKNYQFTALGASPQGAVWAGGFNSDQYNDGMWHKGTLLISGDFKVNKSTVAQNDSTVVFTDQSYGSPETWEWNFGEGASPVTLTGVGPHTVKYTTTGDKTVTLTIQKGEDIQILVMENIVHVTWPDGVNTPTDNQKIQIFPNPVRNNNHISINGFTSGMIDVFNSNGTLVWSSNGMTESNKIYVANLPSGMYIIRIRENNGSITTRRLSVER